MYTVKPVLSGRLKRRPIISFKDQLLLNAGQKYCRMLQGKHSAKLSSSLSYHLSLRSFFLSIFEWPLKTGFTVKYTWICKNFSFANGVDSDLPAVVCLDFQTDWSYLLN